MFWTIVLAILFVIFGIPLALFALKEFLLIMIALLYSPFYVFMLLFGKTEDEYNHKKYLRVGILELLLMAILIPMLFLK